jgi:hypothetical protein
MKKSKERMQVLRFSLASGKESVSGGVEVNIHTAYFRGAWFDSWRIK